MTNKFEIDLPELPTYEDLLTRVLQHEGCDEIRIDECGITIRVLFYTGEYEWQRAYKIRDKYACVRVSVLGQASVYRLKNTPSFGKRYYDKAINWAKRKRQEVLKVLGVKEKKDDSQ